MRVSKSSRFFFWESFVFWFSNRLSSKDLFWFCKSRISLTSWDLCLFKFSWEAVRVPSSFLMESDSRQDS